MKGKRFTYICVVVLAITVCLYKINQHLKIIDLTTFNVETDAQLYGNKVKVIRGIFSINRKNDLEVFSPKNIDDTIFNRLRVKKLNNEYGENDFLLTYDDKYYFQFRHFIFNNHNQHTYNFYFFEKNDSVYLKADIKGPDEMRFQRPMQLISEAEYLRCNAPIDTTKVMYNMIEME